MKKRHRLTMMLEAAERAAIRDNSFTTVVIVFKPGKPGRKTADSRACWRWLPNPALLDEHLEDVGRVLSDP